MTSGDMEEKVHAEIKSELDDSIELYSDAIQKLEEAGIGYEEPTKAVLKPIERSRSQRETKLDVSKTVLHYDPLEPDEKNVIAQELAILENTIYERSISDRQELSSDGYESLNETKIIGELIFWKGVRYDIFQPNESGERPDNSKYFGSVEEIYGGEVEAYTRELVDDLFSRRENKFFPNHLENAGDIIEERLEERN